MKAPVFDVAQDDELFAVQDSVQAGWYGFDRDEPLADVPFEDELFEVQKSA